MYLDTKSLPPEIRRAVDMAGHTKPNIEVLVQDYFVPSIPFTGNRAVAVALDMRTGQCSHTQGSWGGSNAFESRPLDGGASHGVALPPDCVVVSGETGGYGTFFRLFVNPANAARVLPAATDAAPLTETEGHALAGFRLKGGTYRQEHNRAHGVTVDVLDGLAARGLLSKNKAGVFSITTAGKNVQPKLY